MIHYLVALPNLIGGIKSEISHQREFTQKLRLRSETQPGYGLRGTRSQYRAGHRRDRADPKGLIVETDLCNKPILPSLALNPGLTPSEVEAIKSFIVSHKVTVSN